MPILEGVGVTLLIVGAFVGAYASVNRILK